MMRDEFYLFVILMAVTLGGCSHTKLMRCGEQVPGDYWSCPEQVEGPYRACVSPKDIYRCEEVK
jgi:hypothetical protein